MGMLLVVTGNSAESRPWWLRLDGSPRWMEDRWPTTAEVRPLTRRRVLFVRLCLLLLVASAVLMELPAEIAGHYWAILVSVVLVGLLLSLQFVVMPPDRRRQILGLRVKR